MNAEVLNVDDKCIWKMKILKFLKILLQKSGKLCQKYITAKTATKYYNRSTIHSPEHERYLTLEKN